MKKFSLKHYQNLYRMLASVVGSFPAGWDGPCGNSWFVQRKPSFEFIKGRLSWWMVDKQSA